MVVKEYLAGKGSCGSISKKYNISHKGLISTWVNQYETFGEKGLFKARTKGEYTLELKLEALALHETTEMSMREIANQLDIKNLSQISLWKKSYEKEGVAGLQRKRGRPGLNKPKNLSKKKTKPSKELSEDEKDLRIKELEYELRLAKIKNEYLEMLGSLGQEEMKKKRESSTNSETDTN